MKIERLVECVSQLLYEHNCVIIPGFGGFITNFKSAGFEENRNLLCPTRKRVAFNKNLDQNDGLLANHWSKIYSLPYEDSLLEIESFVSDVKNTIAVNRPFEFSNLGTFYLNSENNLIFLPLPNLNFDLASFGLEPIKIKALINKPQGVKLDKPDIKEISISERNIEDTANKVVVKRFFPYKQIAAIFILFVAIIGFMNYEKINNFYVGKSSDVPEQTASLFIPDSNLIISEDSVAETNSFENSQESDKIVTTQSQTNSLIQNSSIDRSVYIVAVGNYTNENKAQLMLDKMREMYPGSRLLSADKSYRIQLESFYNHTTAMAFNVILKQMGYKNVIVIEESAQ